MMKNYFNDTFNESKILVAEEVLLPRHLPEAIVARDNEMERIANAIKPLIKKNTPENLFIHGASGTGKTTCIKHILKQLVSYSSSILPVYVNCWEYSTDNSVYNKIAEELKLPLPRRGLGSSEIFEQIKYYLKTSDKRILIVLDDIDGLKSDELLFVIGHANEAGIMFGIFGVSNDKQFLATLEPKVRNALRFCEYEFKAYNEDQIVEILKKRAEMGLAPLSYDERLLRKIARSVIEGSARIAIERLWRAARKAEDAGKKKIMLEDLENVIEHEPTFKMGELNLSGEEKLILNTIGDHELAAKDIYQRIEQELKKSKRQIRNYLEELERKGLIEAIASKNRGLLETKIYKLRSRG